MDLSKQWQTSANADSRHHFASAIPESCLQVVRVKNKFAFAREELNGGYRDLMLSVLYADPLSGLRIIGEIQVQLIFSRFISKQFCVSYKVTFKSMPQISRGISSPGFRLDKLREDIIQ